MSFINSINIEKFYGELDDKGLPKDLSIFEEGWHGTFKKGF